MFITSRDCSSKHKYNANNTNSKLYNIPLHLQLNSKVLVTSNEPVSLSNSKQNSFSLFMWNKSSESSPYMKNTDDDILQGSSYSK